MGWDVNVFWMIPRENLTEDRFAQSLKSLVDLPLTEVLVYEPEHPDAPLFSTVYHEVLDQMIQGVYFDFIASVDRVNTYWDIPIPQGYGYLKGYWNKRGVEYETPFNELLTTSIARIAEGMGAVFATYFSELVVENFSSFEEIWKTTSYYNFFAWPYVDVVGREAIEELGHTVEVENGIAVFYNKKEWWEEVPSILDAIWAETHFTYEKVIDENSKVRDTETERQVIDKRFLMKSERYEIYPSDSWVYFVCFYPLENHDRDRYTAFIEDVMTLEMMAPESARSSWRDNNDFVDNILEKHRADLLITIPPFKHKSKRWGRRDIKGHCEFTLQLISGLPDGSTAEDPLNRPGMVTAVFRCANKFYKDIEDIQVFLINALKAFAPHLEPSFGFWITDNNWFWKNKGDLDVLERILWPITLYGPGEHLDERRRVLSDRFKEEYGRTKRRWSALSPHPSFILLVNNRYDIDDGYDMSGPDSMELQERLNVVLDGRERGPS